MPPKCQNCGSYLTYDGNHRTMTCTPCHKKWWKEHVEDVEGEDHVIQGEDEEKR